jgi:hypothetical protein
MEAREPLRKAKGSCASMRIDLHTHTTASDGHLTPSALVEAAWGAGIQVLGVTDHDTVDGLSDAAAHAGRLGLTFVAGVELSAYWKQVERHILGYFCDPEDPSLRTFLRHTRSARLERLHAMLNRLGRLGIRVPANEVLAEARGGNVGRPHLARVLLRRGLVGSTQEAFDRYLATGRPAYVPRSDVSVVDAIRVIHEAGGVASLAHPGFEPRDEAIPELVAAGLDAIEVYHPKHLPAETAHYRQLATRHGLLVSGGSDYHGGADGTSGSPGVPCLPEPDFQRLLATTESECRVRA